MLAEPARPDSDYVQERTELRHQVSQTLEARTDTIVSDAVSVFPFAGMEGVEAADSTRLATLILQLITAAIRDGDLDPRSAAVADAQQLAADKNISARPLAGLIYVMERSALDELALDESFGATSEPWPSIAQSVRRGSFEVLAVFSEHFVPDAATLIDPLTTLYTKAVFMTALEKEIQRCERFGRPFALILLDVDRLADINAKHGYGAGDRVIERIGIVIRNYFREHDWVARFAGDAFAVLLPETSGEHAESLAERMRKTVEERLELHDYRSEEQTPITVSVGVVIAESVDQSIRAEPLMLTAKDAVNRAKQAGRNRVERVVLAAARSTSPPPRDIQRVD